MTDLDIVFRGLCSFVRRDKSYEVFLLTGREHKREFEEHGALHKPTMVARIVDLQLTHQADEWKPDFLGYDEKGRQIGIWLLQGLAVTVSGHGSAAQPKWRLDNRDDSIDLGARHSGRDAKPRQELTDAGASVFELVNGDIKTTKHRNRKLILRQGFGPMSKPIRFADDIEWSGPGRTLTAAPVVPHGAHSAGGKLTFVKGAKVAVSNVATVPNGLTHFSAYYEVFAKEVPHDERITVVLGEERGRSLKPDRLFDVPVYDCVDPTPGPPDPSPDK
jgi:hypothetical protein